MSSKIKESILQALIYADIFDYPLTEEELWRRLIKFRVPASRSSVQNLEFRTELEELKLKKIGYKKGYYYLAGKEKVVEKRRKRKKYSREKLNIAKNLVKLLKFIPTIQFVGISGGLAVDNADLDDDIDLFIISKNHLIWTTRFLATLLIGLTGRRRFPGAKDVKNKICLNMFMDEESLAICEKDQNLFIAYEIIQLKPVFDRSNIYQKFLQENNWVEKYLPNTYGKLTLAKSEKDTSEVAKQSCKELLGWWRNQINIFWLIENFLKSFQLWYMRKRRTSEVIKEGIIRFHPQDVKDQVLTQFIDNWKKYQDSYFFLP